MKPLWVFVMLNTFQFHWLTIYWKLSRNTIISCRDISGNKYVLLKCVIRRLVILFIFEIKDKMWTFFEIRNAHYKCFVHCSHGEFCNMNGYFQLSPMMKKSYIFLFFSILLSVVLFRSTYFFPVFNNFVMSCFRAIIFSQPLVYYF